MSLVIRFHQLGGPEVLQVEQRAMPVPAAGEVLINVQAIGMNRADIMFRTGKYLEKVFALEDVVAAHAYLASHQRFGKVVLTTQTAA